MKSKNNLMITGALVSDVVVPSERRYGQFTLVHNFGGGIPSLHLLCRIPRGIIDGILALGLKKGDVVTVKAYIRPFGDTIGAVVKGLKADK